MQPGPSFLGSFTRLPTGWATSRSSGIGTSNPASAVARRSSGSSHRAWCSGSRMTGIRPCTGATTPLAPVVISVHDSTGSSPFSHRSQSPANANGPPSLSRK